MFKRSDYIIISAICFLLGFGIITQYFASKKVNVLTQPETNAVMALEIEQVAKNNASLKSQINELTNNYNNYLKTSDDKSETKKKLLGESKLLEEIVGISPSVGQGVMIAITGELTTANFVDLIDALKNIGATAISINGHRIGTNTFISASNYSSPVTILALGNSSVLESALNRKGGIVEQISGKNVKISVDKKDNITIPAGGQIEFKHGKVIN
ncbi:MAG: DUF881 domain-containing protein [Patescibacteria group bacterium]|jgi:uncharacterized protein YlxW (UPF0749 family)